jgi:hypothetical protein
LDSGATEWFIGTILRERDGEVRVLYDDDNWELWVDKRSVRLLEDGDAVAPIFDDKVTAKRLPSQKRKTCGNGTTTVTCGLDEDAKLCATSKLSTKEYINDRVAAVGGMRVREAVGTIVTNMKGCGSKYKLGDLRYDISKGMLQVEAATNRAANRSNRWCQTQTVTERKVRQVDESAEGVDAVMAEDAIVTVVAGEGEGKGKKREEEGKGENKNKKRGRAPSSGFYGVCADGKRWRAQIWHGGKKHDIGSFNTKEEAALAYDTEAGQCGEEQQRWIKCAKLRRHLQSKHAASIACLLCGTHFGRRDSEKRHRTSGRCVRRQHRISAHRRRTAATGGAGSKYRGVNWLKKNKKWRARFKYAGKSYYLGCFEDEAEAARAYDRAARAQHGEKAQLNFPAGGEGTVSGGSGSGSGGGDGGGGEKTPNYASTEAAEEAAAAAEHTHTHVVCEADSVNSQQVDPSAKRPRASDPHVLPARNTATVSAADDERCEREVEVETRAESESEAESRERNCCECGRRKIMGHVCFAAPAPLAV